MLMMAKKNIAGGLLCLLVMSVLGCGGGGADDQPDLGLVTGTVTLDGKPLAGVEVLFLPTGGRPSQGNTDDAGKYELAYTRDANGAVLGKHTVQISTVFDPDAPPSDSAVKVPEQYGEQSTLTAEVVAGENTFDFKLE